MAKEIAIVMTIETVRAIVFPISVQPHRAAATSPRKVRFTERKPVFTFLVPSAQKTLADGTAMAL
uniref:hypothetical protein n=1 Tax=Sphingomonas sp. TaxID=28214 RepID=UPI0025FE1760|nr:hypothetical protein [Sphingomonas sp.]